MKRVVRTLPTKALKLKRQGVFLAILGSCYMPHLM